MEWGEGVGILTMHSKHYSRLDAGVLIKMPKSLGMTLIKAEKPSFPVVLPFSVTSKLLAIKLIRKVRRIELWF